MIGGAVTGGGGPALGRHLVNPDHNEDVRAGESRGLMAETVDGQVAELTELADASGHKAPLRHVHASPPPGASWGKQDWDDYWTLYERAMGLEGCAFSEAIHDKPGSDGRPPHRHRVYLALTERGTLVRIGHDYARQEAVSRITEHDTGAAFVKGAHNIRAATIVRILGRNDVADAMQAAGLLDGARARADLSPMDRAQQERTYVSKASVAASVAQAWAASDGGPAFAAALAEQGLRLARGDKCPVIVDSTGNAHSLQRMLAMDARANGTEALQAGAIAARLDGVALPGVLDARHAIAALAPPSPPDDGPPSPDAPTPPGGGQATPGDGDIPHAHAPAPASHGGDAPAPMAVQVAPGAMLEDAGPGPGEPPGPAAHPDELARYRAALHAHAERKHAALQAFMRSMAAASEVSHQATTTGGHYGTAQQLATPSWQQWWPAAVGTAITAGYTAEEARAAIRAAGIDARDNGHSAHGIGAEQGHECPGSGEGQGHPTGGEGREHAQQPGRHATATADGARPGGERGLGGSEGAADGHRGAADSPGGPPGQDRVQAYRAARGLDTLNLSSLRDRLNPARVSIREAERIRADIAGHRAMASGQANTPAAQRDNERQDRLEIALDRVMDRVHVGDRITLTAIRQHGIHELVRQEGLHVLMEQGATSHLRCADQASHAAADARVPNGGPWSPNHG